MTSILKADTIQDTDGNNIINENSNTITIGASGDTITIPSGCTITNNGTNGGGFGRIVGIATNTFGGSTINPTVNSTVALSGYNVTYAATSTSNRLGFVFNLGYVNVRSYTGITGAKIHDGTDFIHSNFVSPYIYLISNTAEIPGQGAVWNITPSSTNSTTYTIYIRTYRPSGSNNIDVGLSDFEGSMQVFEYEV